MRLLSAAKAAAFVLAFAPVAAIATPAGNASLLLQLGNPFLSYFTGTTGSAMQVALPNSPLLGISVAASGSDFQGSTYATAANGTFIDFNGGGIDFANGANTLALNDIQLNLVTGQFSADLIGNGSDLGRQNIFHYTLGGSTTLGDLAADNTLSIGFGVSTSTKTPVLDKNGNPVRDKNGNIIYMSVIIPAGPGNEAFFLNGLKSFGVVVANGATAGTGQILVPEPAMFALFGLGAGLIGVARRRTK